jgi:hypothetical protein
MSFLNRQLNHFPGTKIVKSSIKYRTKRHSYLFLPLHCCSFSHFPICIDLNNRAGQLSKQVNFCYLLTQDVISRNFQLLRAIAAETFRVFAFG